MIKLLLCAVALATACALAPASSVTAAGTPGTWSGMPQGDYDWGPIGPGVSDIAMLGDDIVVAGSFEKAGAINAADYIARWDGEAWSAIGSAPDGGPAFNAPVVALAVSGTTLYAVGNFTDAGGDLAADYVAAWDGTEWAALGGGANGAFPTTVNTQGIAVAVDGDDVLVGGSFQNVDGIAAADYLARWSNGAWSAVGSHAGNGALTSAVHEILVSGDNVYVGGSFRDAFGNPAADHIARWNGSSWSALGADDAGDGMMSDSVYALVKIGSDVYAGGNFLNVEWKTPHVTNYVRRWDGATWHSVGNIETWDLNGPVRELAVLNGKLIAGGNFNLSADYIGILNGTTWSTLGPDGALDAPVNALLISDGDVYAGGSFKDAAGIQTADHIAKLEIPSDHKPDARIRKGSAALRGNNVYEDDALHQTLTAGKRRGESVKFTVNIQNDGTVRERFSVHATGPSTSMYTVTLFRGTTNITAAVLAGTYQTPMLSPGSTHQITATVKVKQSATIGSTVTRLVSVTSSIGAGGVDAVKFLVQRV